MTDKELPGHVGDATDEQPQRPPGERAALDLLAERLADQFPELSADEIADTIYGHYKDFDRRDFVPMLVERAVRADIEQPTKPSHRYRA